MRSIRPAPRSIPAAAPPQPTSRSCGANAPRAMPEARRCRPPTRHPAQGLGFGSHAQRSRCRLPCSRTPLAWDLGAPCSWTPGTGLSNPDSGLIDGGFRRWPRHGMHEVYWRQDQGRHYVGVQDADHGSQGGVAVLGEVRRGYETGSLTRTTVSGLSSSRRERPFGRVDSSPVRDCCQSRHRVLAQGHPGAVRSRQGERRPDPNTPWTPPSAF
jgi:hypothetical protein